VLATATAALNKKVAKSTKAKPQMNQFSTLYMLNKKQRNRETKKYKRSIKIKWLCCTKK